MPFKMAFQLPHVTERGKMLLKEARLKYPQSSASPESIFIIYLSFKDCKSLLFIHTNLLYDDKMSMRTMEKHESTPCVAKHNLILKSIGPCFPVLTDKSEY